MRPWRQIRVELALDDDTGHGPDSESGAEPGTSVSRFPAQGPRPCSLGRTVADFSPADGELDLTRERPPDRDSCESCSAQTASAHR